MDQTVADIKAIPSKTKDLLLQKVDTTVQEVQKLPVKAGSAVQSVVVTAKTTALNTVEEKKKELLTKASSTFPISVLVPVEEKISKAAAAKGTDRAIEVKKVKEEEVKPKLVEVPVAPMPAISNSEAKPAAAEVVVKAKTQEVTPPVEAAAPKAEPTKPSVAKVEPKLATKIEAKPAAKAEGKPFALNLPFSFSSMDRKAPAVSLERKPGAASTLKTEIKPSAETVAPEKEVKMPSEPAKMPSPSSFSSFSTAKPAANSASKEENIQSKHTPGEQTKTSFSFPFAASAPKLSAPLASSTNASPITSKVPEEEKSKAANPVSSNKGSFPFSFPSQSRSPDPKASTPPQPTATKQTMASSVSEAKAATAVATKSEANESKPAPANKPSFSFSFPSGGNKPGAANKAPSSAAANGGAIVPFTSTLLSSTACKALSAYPAAKATAVESAVKSFIKGEIPAEILYKDMSIALGSKDAAFSVLPDIVGSLPRGDKKTSLNSFYQNQA